MPLRLLHRFSHPYRLFHISARLRLRDRPSPSTLSQGADDYYALLLQSSTPTPTAKKIVNPARTPKSTNPSSSSNVPPPSSATPAQDSDKASDTRILFSKVASGPSPKVRGLARAEKGLERPPEPDNCCMSGCVNCVWDAYREEVEEWAAARRRQDRGAAAKAVGSRRGRSGGVGEGVVGEGEDGGGVGDLDEVGGLSGYEGMDLSGEDEGRLFEGVPVGIRVFMNTEKTIREKRIRERRGLDGERSYEGRSIESWKMDKRKS